MDACRLYAVQRGGIEGFSLVEAAGNKNANGLKKKKKTLFMAEQSRQRTGKHTVPLFFWGGFAAKFDEISNKLLTFKHGVGKPGV